MVSAKPAIAKEIANRESPVSAAPLQTGSSEPQPEFWRELYWFVVLCLMGWILALAVLPPKAERLATTRSIEEETRARVESLTLRELQYRQAIEALDDDPFFRGEVFHVVLGWHKDGEERLDAKPVWQPNLPPGTTKTRSLPRGGRTSR